jgi:hypothetical protein
VRLAAFIASACAAAAVAAGSAQASTSCWEQVISDWSAHNAVRGSYAPGCYRTAIAKLPEDLRSYSSASDDIRRALQVRLTKSAAAPQTKAEPTGGGNANRHLLLFGAVLVAVVALAVVAIR